MTAPRPGLAPPYRLELAGTQEDSYLEGTVEQLFGLLLEVLKKRQPEIQAVFTDGLIVPDGFLCTFWHSPHPHEEYAANHQKT